MINTQIYPVIRDTNPYYISQAKLKLNTIIRSKRSDHNTRENLAILGGFAVGIFSLVGICYGLYRVTSSHGMWDLIKQGRRIVTNPSGPLITILGGIFGGIPSSTGLGFLGGWGIDFGLKKRSERIEQMYLNIVNSWQISDQNPDRPLNRRDIRQLASTLSDKELQNMIPQFNMINC